MKERRMSQNPHEDLMAFLDAERKKARREALEEAAELRFTLRIPTPRTGPFTIQQMAVDDYRAAIKAMI
jgi:hypothetical protein